MVIGSAESNSCLIFFCPRATSLSFLDFLVDNFEIHSQKLEKVKLSTIYGPALIPPTHLLLQSPSVTPSMMSVLSFESLTQQPVLVLSTRMILLFPYNDFNAYISQ